MKTLLSITLALASIGIMSSWTDIQATPVASTTNPQVRIQIGRQGRRYRDTRYRDFREVTQTRVVRYGWRTYRETYQVRYLPDGRTETTMVSRVRIN